MGRNRMKRGMERSGIVFVLASILGGALGSSIARADMVNVAENATIQCINFSQSNCIKINDGNRYTYGTSAGAFGDSYATVFLDLPAGATVVELFWHGWAYADYNGSSYMILTVKETDDSWTTIASGTPVVEGTVPLDPPRRITEARIWGSRGTYMLPCIYRFYELEVWAEGVPDDYFFGGDRWIPFDGDPVNTATGNFMHEETDFSIAGRVEPLVFSRFYNAQDSTDGPLGPGWTHSYNIALDTPDDQVTVRWHDGRVDYWQEDGQGGYEPVYPGRYDELVKNGDDTWTVTRKNMDVYQFDTSGRLTSVADQHDNTTAMAYTDPSFPDLVTGVTDPAGRTLTLDYNSNGLLESVTDFDSPPRVVQYEYTSGRLTRVTDVLVNTIEYVYTGAGYLETITDQLGVTTVTNVYDGDGRVSEQRDGRDNVTTFAYDTPSVNQTTITRTATVDGAPQTLETIHTYDEGFKLMLSVRNPLGDTVTFGYNEDNDRDSITNRNGRTTQFTYDERGNVTSATETDDPTDPYDGGVTTIEYDDPAFPDLRTRKVDANSNGTDWTYNSNGDMSTEVRWLDTEQTESVTKSWTYNSFGQRLTETDERGNIHQWVYDADGLLTEEIDRQGNHLWYGYDELWRRTWVTDGRGTGPEDSDYTTYYTYDDADRLTQITGPPVGSPAHSIVRNFGYNEIGDLTTVTDGNGNTTQYFYDDTRNLIRVEEPLDSDPQGRVTQYEYDEINRRVSRTDANSNAIAYEYDNGSRLVEQEDGEGNLRSYTYDAHGNLLTETDPSGVYLTYEYDALNRRTLIRDELGNEKNLNYDKLGQFVGYTDANDNQRDFVYDAIGRLTCVVDAENNWTEYGYDETDNLTEIEDADDKAVNMRQYDELNRLILAEDGNGNVYEYSYDEVGNQTWVTDAKLLTTQLTYDAESRLAQIDYPDGAFVTHTYDDNGNRVETADSNGLGTFTYDELNRLRSSTDHFNQQVVYSYDPVGNRTSLTYPDSKQVVYGYDQANRLTTITDWASRVTQYTYDGMRTSTVTYPNGVVEAWGYDLAGRVNSLDTENSTSNGLLSFAWTRDGMGNLSSSTETGTLQPTLEQLVVDYTYDTDNRLVETSQGTYEHDANGNLVSRTVGGTTTIFAYDSEDRLISQTTGGDTVEHVYDGDGNRIARINSNGETRYVLDSGRSMSHVLCETDDAGAITTYYIHGPWLVAGYDTNGTQRYYHKNCLGTVVALSNENEQIVDRYAHTPFGLLRAQEGTTVNPYTYVGGLGVMAEADGLYFMRARFYDPDTGRFLGKDPIEGGLLCPCGLHRYVYGLNNPIIASDPTGEYALIDDVTAAGIGLVGGVGGVFMSDMICLSHGGGFSGWETYAGAGVGGAIAGWGTLYVGPAAWPVGAASGSTITQALEIGTGKREEFSSSKLIIDTAIGTASMGLGGGLRSGSRMIDTLGGEAATSGARFLNSDRQVDLTDVEIRSKWDKSNPPSLCR